MRSQENEKNENKKKKKKTLCESNKAPCVTPQECEFCLFYGSDLAKFGQRRNSRQRTNKRVEKIREAHQHRHVQKVFIGLLLLAAEKKNKIDRTPTSRICRI